MFVREKWSPDLTTELSLTERVKNTAMRSRFALKDRSVGSFNRNFKIAPSIDFFKTNRVSTNFQIDRYKTKIWYLPKNFFHPSNFCFSGKSLDKHIKMTIKVCRVIIDQMASDHKRDLKKCLFKQIKIFMAKMILH